MRLLSTKEIVNNIWKYEIYRRYLYEEIRKF